MSLLLVEHHRLKSPIALQACASTAIRLRLVNRFEIREGVEAVSLVGKLRAMGVVDAAAVVVVGVAVTRSKVVAMTGAALLLLMLLMLERLQGVLVATEITERLNFSSRWTAHRFI